MEILERSSVAEIFKKFILVEGSGGPALVNVDSIEYIYSTNDNKSGKDIVTKSGQMFWDNSGFDELKSLIKSVIEDTHPKAESKSSPEVVKPEPKVVPLNEKPVSEPKVRRINRVPIVIDEPATGGAVGKLPYTPEIVDRRNIVIQSNDGRILGRGSDDGNGIIVGDYVSGIVSISGTYRLVFKNYSDSKAFISYSVKEK